MGYTKISACFTGHRKIRKKDKSLETNLGRIVEDLILSGYTTFYTGGSRGFDALASETVLKLKDEYPYISLIIVLPFENTYEYEKDWTWEDIKRHFLILEQADDVILLQKNYSRGCYYKRDRYIVDESSSCICYKYKKSGGTAYTVEYAREQGLNILNCIDI